MQSHLSIRIAITPQFGLDVCLIHGDDEICLAAPWNLRCAAQHFLKEMEARGVEMRVISVVIPALNEAENMVAVLGTIPHDELADAGWAAEVIVVDNGSADGTGDIAGAAGALVVVETRRGYGSAYRAGFAAATGEVIATGDADRTYPFGILHLLVAHLERNELDFLSTNRLHPDNRITMRFTHRVANRVLTTMSSLLIGSPFRDSQSGMWIFRRAILASFDIRSSGMAFSQEIKHEAHLKGFRCGEVDIDYYRRGGVVKLNAGRDGVTNVSQIIGHWYRGRVVVHRGAGRNDGKLGTVAERGKVS